MPDPAVDAASRVWDGDPEQMAHILVSAAREALKPIRAKYEYLNARFGDGNTEMAVGIRWVLEDLATLIYTTEELER
ncbi:hypothetical protein A5746_14350 [Mycolicibacterium conceptionense]|uniref:hypothetical protein n=1 Tax=Mycolicibacterium conceptionense TaxID=451644 RepID=UPI00096F538D|nr:hypothetical protein [Mycolicibacterium conceptionense]OMB98540.1 hypothetical protein A5746_14350 [Mycolicibacterium conceptionense]